MVDKPKRPPKPQRPRLPSLWPLFKPYKGQMAMLVLLTAAGNALNLAVPKVAADAIDAFTTGRLNLDASLVLLAALALGTFVFGNLQNIVQTVASERVARDLRTQLAETVSEQTYSAVETMTPAKLLTNFTSDVDAIKGFVAQAAPTLWIIKPRLDSRLASQMRRNSLIRSGAARPFWEGGACLGGSVMGRGCLRNICGCP